MKKLNTLFKESPIASATALLLILSLHSCAPSGAPAPPEQTTLNLDAPSARDSEAPINSLTMELIHCPAGEFYIGSPDHEPTRMKDEEQGLVQFRQGFWMGKTEVTQEQWVSVMGESSNPSTFQGDSQNPVENVTWEQASNFCTKLTEMESASGKLPEGWRYHLPTESQWEYACRAGTEGPHALELEDGAWYRDNAYKATHPVGLKFSNAWGFHDMHGNVWEWCRDYYSDSPHRGGFNPKGPKEGKLHVLKGGAWNQPPRFCRSAFRAYPQRLNRKPAPGTIGFRVVLEQVNPNNRNTQTH